jgi:hypothetical protein
MNAYTALGAGGRGFESRHPDQTRRSWTRRRDVGDSAPAGTVNEGRDGIDQRNHGDVRGVHEDKFPRVVPGLKLAGVRLGSCCPKAKRRERQFERPGRCYLGASCTGGPRCGKSVRSEFGGPVPEIGAQFRGALGWHWQVLVAEPLDAGEHVGEDLVVESWVVVGGPVEELVAAESVGEIVDVGEVPGFGAAEQGQGLAGGEIAQAQGGSQVGGIDRFFCRAVSARSTMRLSRLPVISRRTKSLWSITRWCDHPRSPIAVSNEAAADVIVDAAASRRNRSTSLVWRWIRPCTMSAAPPATAKPALWGRLKNSCVASS